MTAKELVLGQLNSTGKQLAEVFTNLPDSAADVKISSASMTPREIAGHLCECYIAFDAASQGKQHEWGSFVAPDLPMNQLVSHLMDLRNKAVQIVTDSDQDTHLGEAMDYVSNHDSYHIGQLVLARIQADPGWDPYSLYQ